MGKNLGENGTGIRRHVSSTQTPISLPTQVTPLNQTNATNNVPSKTVTSNEGDITVTPINDSEYFNKTLLEHNITDARMVIAIKIFYFRFLIIFFVGLTFVLQQHISDRCTSCQTLLGGDE